MAPCHSGKALAMIIAKSVLLGTNLMAWETGKHVHTCLVLYAAKSSLAPDLFCVACLGQATKTIILLMEADK